MSRRILLLFLKATALLSCRDIYFIIDNINTQVQCERKVRGHEHFNVFLNGYLWKKYTQLRFIYQCVSYINKQVYVLI